MNWKGEVRVVKRNEVLGNKGIDKKTSSGGEGEEFFSVNKFHLIQTKYIMLIKQI